MGKKYINICYRVVCYQCIIYFRLAFPAAKKYAPLSSRSRHLTPELSGGAKAETIKENENIKSTPVAVRSNELFDGGVGEMRSGRACL